MLGDGTLRGATLEACIAKIQFAAGKQPHFCNVYVQCAVCAFVSVYLCVCVCADRR